MLRHPWPRDEIKVRLRSAYVVRGRTNYVVSSDARRGWV
jgi:hypothetical protein